jgi:nucleoside-diphosphate-sugar epimerase
MNVVVAGGTGFIGKAVVQDLVTVGHRVKVLARHLANVPHEAVTMMQANITSRETLNNILTDSDAVINLAGIIREHPNAAITFDRVHYHGTRNLADAATVAGVKRFVYVSALGVTEQVSLSFYRSKFLAEQYLKSKSFDVTIFRPSIVFGRGRDEQSKFIQMQQAFIKALPVMPIAGDGKVCFQPIALQTLASAICKSLAMPETFDKTYDAVGRKKLSYNDMVDGLQTAMNCHRPKMHIPLGFLRFLADRFDGFAWFPVTSTQLQILSTDNVADAEPFNTAFDVASLQSDSFFETLQYLYSENDFSH